MAMKKKPGEHPRLEDFNQIYGSRHIQKLASAHKKLKRRFRLGDHVEHVPGIETNDIRYWRVHMRMMPELVRTLLQETIHHSLSATKPIPIEWVVKPRRRTGWVVGVTEQRGRLIVEVAPPPIPEPAAKRKRRAT
jgi:hypothetical protein